MYGGFPEWPKGTDCKSAGDAFGGSNPPSPTKNRVMPYGMARFFCCGVRGVEVYTPLGVNPPSPSKKTVSPSGGAVFLLWGRGVEVYTPLRGESTIPHQKTVSPLGGAVFLLWGSWSRSLYPFRGESTIPHHAAASYVLFKTASFHPFPAQNRQTDDLLPASLLRRPFFLSVRSERPLAPIAASWHNSPVFRIYYGKRTRFLIACLQ